MTAQRGPTYSLRHDVVWQEIRGLARGLSDSGVDEERPVGAPMGQWPAPIVKLPTTLPELCLDFFPWLA